ncbi:MAG: HAD-IA family hydrolase [Planctomycetota bacterium]|jgi:putative hydrolase of the HAD superfamily
MSLKAVLLDVGNTLLYEQPPRHIIYAEAARERGLVVEDARMLELMRAAHSGLPTRIDGAYRYSDRWFSKFIERIYVDELGLSRDWLSALVDSLFDRFEQAETFRIFDGAETFLEALGERGLIRGVVSNWSSRLPRVLEAKNLAGHFDFVVCSAIEACEKPDARIFQLALDRAGCRPDEAVHCGDHPLKDGLAVQVGMRAVVVDHFDKTPQTDLPRVGDFDELLQWIDGQRA